MGYDLMLVGGAGGDLGLDRWRAWIMAYKGWLNEEWSLFYQQWERAPTLADKNKILDAEGIRIFTWGATSVDEGPAKGGKGKVGKEVHRLAREMEGMRDITLIGISKGGNLVLHYLALSFKGEISGPTPERIVLLGPSTWPYARWCANVPSCIPQNVGGACVGVPAPPQVPPIPAVNICSHGDIVCPLTISGAHNINPPWEGHGHGWQSDYAERVIDMLDVALHHQAKEIHPLQRRLYGPF